MGWKGKAGALLLGLLLFGFGAWPLGLLCFFYLFVTLRPRRSRPADHKPRGRFKPSRRLALAALMFTLAGVAMASGGVLSPLAFLSVGAVSVAWPLLVRRLNLGELTPVGESILMRSRYFPFSWRALAELKPGPEQFPLAMSSFSGPLLAFTDTGRTYCLVAARAWGRKEAEEKVIGGLRSLLPAGRPGAYLLPLDSGASADLMRVRLTPANLPSGDVPKSVASFSGVLAIECVGGRVTRASAFHVDGRAVAASLPGRPKELVVPPLTWEVFDSIGKRTRWPDPDRYSDLLDSMHATRGAPLAERVSQLESSGDLLKVRSLSGDEIPTSRQQLRAIVSIYS